MAAGGGSILTFDGARFRVGPESAGADPGPACYDQGGTQATVTDANLLLGRLDAANFLGGRMLLDEAKAEQSLSMLAGELNLDSAAQAAWQVIQVANATMERAIRRISVERGYDPRLFTLVAFGGAGPLHACELAAQLQIPRVLLPAVPGVLSALGMLAAAPMKDYVQTVMREMTEELQLLPWLDEQFDHLRKTAVSDMKQEGHPPEDLTFEPALDMRYLGQSHELTVPYARPDLAGVFHTAHSRRFGYQRPSSRLEIVNIRLKVVANTRPLELDQLPLLAAPGKPKSIGTKQVWFAGQPHQAALFQRQDLAPGQNIPGPAIIFQYDTTTVIPPGWQARVDPFANLVINR